MHRGTVMVSPTKGIGGKRDLFEMNSNNSTITRLIWAHVHTSARSKTRFWFMLPAVFCYYRECGCRTNHGLPFTLSPTRIANWFVLRRSGPCWWLFIYGWYVFAGKAFDITYVRLWFYSPRPESFSIFKKTSENSPWIPYQYYRYLSYRLRSNCGCGVGEGLRAFSWLHFFHETLKGCCVGNLDISVNWKLQNSIKKTHTQDTIWKY